MNVFALDNGDVYSNDWLMLTNVYIFKEVRILLTNFLNVIWIQYIYIA